MMCIIACSTTTYKEIDGFEYKVTTREAEPPKSVIKDPNQSFFSWLWGSDKEEPEPENKSEQAMNEKAAEKAPESAKNNLRRERLQLRRNRYLLLQSQQ